ncbi:MAG: hypothetical protein HY815_27480 [Candidatus Riflebacteria bacterium]|nr:hypothetical protein [Candidatus Riflebacteria bacterium]
MTAQLCILICCDDPERLVASASALRTAGYDVQLQDAPGRVVPTLQQKACAGILLDLARTPTQAFFLLTQIRELAGDRRLPILLITDELRPTDTIRGLQAGATDCLTRSSPVVDVIRAFERYLPSTVAVAAAPAAPFPPPPGPVAQPPPNRPSLLSGPMKDQILHEILGSLDVGVLVLSDILQVDYVNRAGRQLLELWTPGRPFLAERTGGVPTQELLRLLAQRGSAGASAQPITLVSDQGKPRRITGSMTMLLDNAGRSLGSLIVIRSFERPTVESFAPSGVLRLSEDIISSVDRAERSLNVLSRSIEALHQHRLLANPTVRISFELFKDELERMVALIRLLREGSKPVG